MDNRLLRIHHLLCIPLFVGEGYSGPFCENMSRIKRELDADLSQTLTAVCRADMICAGCPNLVEGRYCRDDDSKVDRKDQLLAEKFGIDPEKRYTYGELLCMAEAKLTEEMFTESCKNCQWFAQGLCSYEKWKIGLDKIKKMC